MADRRRPEARITLETPAGRRVAELFPAELFAGRPGATPGRYRVRIDRAWYAPGEKYVFVTLQEAFAVLAGLAGVAPSEPAPKIPVGSWVRVPSRVIAGAKLYTRTHTIRPPFQGVDGRWRVFCALFNAPVLVDDIA
ncbi:hypothetical protein JCM15519_38560 [Fundidesulfovibrio butyratiphilus]